MSEIQATEADIERFYKYVEKLPNGCHFWNGARTKGKGNRKWYHAYPVATHTNAETY